MLQKLPALEICLLHFKCNGERNLRRTVIYFDSATTAKYLARMPQSECLLPLSYHHMASSWSLRQLIIGKEMCMVF